MGPSPEINEMASGVEDTGTDLPQPLRKKNMAYEEQDQSWVTPPDANCSVPVKYESAVPIPTTPASTEIVKSAAQFRDENVAGILKDAYSKASTLVLTKDEATKLQEPFPDSAVEIRPHDGLLYIPHITVGRRLHQVFGPGQWCMIRRNQYLQGNTVMAEWALLVRGCFVGETLEGHPYQPNNPKMDYGDSLESTRGLALRRIAAKDLNCGSQVWEPEYCRQWCEKYSEHRGGKYSKRSNAPITHAMVPPSVQAPSPAPTQPTAIKVAPRGNGSATDTAEGLLAASKAKFIKLVEPIREFAWAYLVQEGYILDNEQIKDVSVTKLFPHFNPETYETQRDTNRQAIKEDFDALMAGIQNLVDAGETPTPELAAKFDAAYAAKPEDSKRPKCQHCGSSENVIQMQNKGKVYQHCQVCGREGWLGEPPKTAQPVSQVIPNIEPERDSNYPEGSKQIKGMVMNTTTKSGRKNNKEWTRYGLLIGETWYNTFDRKLAEKAMALKGRECLLTYIEKGNFKDAVEIEAY